MPWERGEASVEVEMSRLQSWVEQTDPELHGKNGDKGIIRQFWDDRATIKGILLVLTFLGGADFIMQFLRTLGLIR